MNPQIELFQMPETKPLHENIKLKLEIEQVRRDMAAVMAVNADLRSRLARLEGGNQ